MNFKKYHVSKNLFNQNDYELIQVAANTYRYGTIVGILPQGAYTFNAVKNTTNDIYLTKELNGVYTYETISSLPFNFTADGETKYIIRTAGVSGTTWADFGYTNMIINLGSQPLPYEPYGNTWTETPYYLHNTSTDTITTLPADIYANAATATVGLKGNTFQSGTPSPQNPVMPEGCGNMTGNLFDGSIEQGSLNETVGIGTDYNNTKTPTAAISPYRVRTANPIYIDRELTLSIDFNNYQMYVLFYDENRQYTGEHSSSWRNSFLTLSGEYIGKYIGLAIKSKAGGSVPISPTDDIKLMFNTGSTPLPYEPYGIKIPISSANTTTPVYLGEVETTRRIKKLVLTGSADENWSTTTIGINDYIYRMELSDLPKSGVTPICTHYTGSTATRWVDIANYEVTTSILNSVAIRHSGLTGVSDWKTYLQQQYAAGTPVTVWYVLATPETAVVNEPLQKIGNYADEVSGISIPVTAGGDTLSVGTTVQPSEINVNYKGWHPKTPKESNNGQWS